MIRYLLFILVMVWIPRLALKAQHAICTSRIQGVQQDGFYRIPLPSVITAHLQPNAGNIRVLDAQGREHPYYFVMPQRKEESTYHALPFQEVQTSKGIQTLVIENRLREWLDHLDVQLEPADAERSIRINGSDDGVHYYVVCDSVLLHLSKANAHHSYSVSFPETKYRFYRLEIGNGQRDPIQIRKIGYTLINTHQPAYQRVEGVQFSTQDSGKLTILHLNFQPANTMEALQIWIHQPQRYLREANVYRWREVQRQVGRRGVQTEKVREWIGSLELSSEHEGPYLLPDEMFNERQGRLDIEINNEHDASLHIDSLNALQWIPYLVTELKANESYQVVLEDNSKEAPKYDIIHFLPKQLDQLPLVALEQVVQTTRRTPTVFVIHEHSYLVWIGLVAAAIILLWIITSMVRGMANQRR